jgi:hypothetical protein
MLHRDEGALAMTALGQVETKPGTPRLPERQDRSEICRSGDR